MSKNEWKKWVCVVGRMLLAYALVFAQGAWATQNQGTKDKAASPQKAPAQQTGEKQSSAAVGAKAQSGQTQSEESESSVAEEKSSRDGSHEGIKVHGHWTIEVRNPDGALVTHREFENSLAQGGSALASILSRNATTGGWAVELDDVSVGAGVGGLCQLTGSASAYCLIAENSSLLPGVNSANLQVVATSTLSLTGSVTTYGGTVGLVRTKLTYCTPSTIPSACVGATISPPLQGFTIFSSAVISPGVSVLSGQTLSVAVVFSFS